MPPTASESPRPVTEILTADWRGYFERAHEAPRHTGARDLMRDDLRAALARLIPSDASLLEAGSGTGDLLAGFSQASKTGVDFLPAVVERARARHPGLHFRLGDVTAETWAQPDERWDAVICDRLCHSVLDIKRLLESLRARLTEHGRLYLTTFNYLWELPALLAEQLGWKIPSPTANWLSDTDFKNLYAMVGLEIVRYEDRLILPLDLGFASTLLNRYVARLPGLQTFSLYRVYVLRACPLPAAIRQASVSVVVPTRNEAGNVQAAIDRTPVMGSSTELIFVEGGSTDDTWGTIQDAIGRYRGPLRLSAYQQEGKGKGDAVRLGFARATGDLLMILDADLTVPPEDLPQFHDLMVRGQADYVQGTRLVYPMEPGAMRFFNKIGNVAFSQLFTYLLQQPIKDTLCGTKVLWRTDYDRLVANRSYFGDFDPFGDFDLIFGAARLNLKIAEIPIRYRDRTYGETNISRWKHGWLLLRMSALAARKLKFV